MDATTVVIWVLTALAAVVVVLTRVRLSRGESGQHQQGRSVLGLHTVAGVLGLAVWTTFLLAPDDTLAGGALAGVIALACWWLTMGAGLLLLLRWKPSRGKRAAASTGDGWTRGPWLSVLAHLGMVVGVGVFTWAYLTHAV